MKNKVNLFKRKKKKKDDEIYDEFQTSDLGDPTTWRKNGFEESLESVRIQNINEVLLYILHLVEEHRLLAADAFLKELEKLTGTNVAPEEIPIATPVAGAHMNGVQHDPVVASQCLPSALNQESIGKHQELVANVASQMMGKHLHTLSQLRFRAMMVERSIEEFTQEGDWNIAQTLMGITTRYKPDEDGSLWIRLDGDMEDCSIFDQLAVVREAGLYKIWSPFCNKSEILRQVTPVEMGMHINISVPPVTNRDAVIHAFGVDCTYEHDAIVLLGNSVTHFEGVELPQCKGMNSARMEVRGFKSMVRIKSPMCANTSIVANVDTKMHLPQVVVNFIMKKMAGMMLWCLQKEAKKISIDMAHPHAIKIRQDPFYREWLLPRVTKYCQYKGWDVPAVPALDWMNSPCGRTKRLGQDETNGTSGEKKKKKKGLKHKVKKVILRKTKKKNTVAGSDIMTEDDLKGQAEFEQLVQEHPQLVAKWQQWKEKKMELVPPVVHPTPLAEVTVDPIYSTTTRVGSETEFTAPAESTLDKLLDLKVGPLLIAVVFHQGCNRLHWPWPVVQQIGGFFGEALLQSLINVCTVGAVWRLGFAGIQHWTTRRLGTLSSLSEYTNQMVCRFSLVACAGLVVLALISGIFQWLVAKIRGVTVIEVDDQWSCFAIASKTFESWSFNIVMLFVAIMYTFQLMVKI